MITLGDIVMALFEFVADFFLSFWPWGEDKKEDKK
jgi:hypothetical protein